MNRIPGYNLLNFASQIDDNTIEQAKETASMPFIHPHVALMPDAHSGKGSAVGTVIPTVGAIIPAAVGVDIGCGMIAVRTAYVRAHLDGRDLSKLRASVESAIPLSPGNYNRTLDRFDFTAEKIAGPTHEWERECTVDRPLVFVVGDGRLGRMTKGDDGYHRVEFDILAVANA